MQSNDPSYPDCATIMLDASGKALRTFSCAIGGFGGVYSASWGAPTTNTEVASSPTTSPGASPASSAKNPAQTGGSNTATGGDSNKVGGDGVIGGGIGGNTFGNGNTIIYGQLAGTTRPSLLLVGGGWAVVMFLMLLL
ncbi:hypothetical protein B0T25DRAFT_517832 [Lasiosphaeria hispida]|uniref:Uncharacterized protein n=1 Tax=Lasiosphaeria hispida TaxID=260671 RepID=A0AAJ0HH40_9PEZI|nr:hypothetical protein B0T25DRAFT_517832 [Lasiosphaeria hispida]